MVSRISSTRSSRVGEMFSRCSLEEENSIRKIPALRLNRASPVEAQKIRTRAPLQGAPARDIFYRHLDVLQIAFELLRQLGQGFIDHLVEVLAAHAEGLEVRRGVERRRPGEGGVRFVDSAELGIRKTKSVMSFRKLRIELDRALAAARASSGCPRCKRRRASR